MTDKFRDGADPKDKAQRVELLKNGLEFDPERYVYKEDWKPAKHFLETHSTAEMIEYLRANKECELDARVVGMRRGERGHARMNREQFLEAAKRKDSKRLRESVDGFGMDSHFDSQIIGGPDFTPLLGGPFNKQLYYRDYLRMISACFYAYNHDPVARATVSIMVDFTLGRGYQLKAEKPEAQALWNAFEEANRLHEQMDHCAIETSIYGENMWWWLPNNNARISFNPGAGEKIPKALLPRIRIIDPSNIAEIITVPEDIYSVLYYVWLAPTQYQMYTRDNQPSSKFIYTQIPAEQIIHNKINSVSNEKRGRSDYFPALGYMKLLRDGVNYALVAQQKAAAWCIDTTIEGDDNDFDDYIDSQKKLGAIPTAGSEFVHTAAVKREYLSNSATSRGGDPPAFTWSFSMAAMAAGIPISYYGTHLHSGSSRASALVSTEPVAKRFERRQLVYQRTLTKIFNGLMEWARIDSECEILFPELITQDRSAMLRDLTLAQNNSWISHERAANIAAKELDANNFNYQQELNDIKRDDETLGISPSMTVQSPLTSPGKAQQTEDKPGGMTGDQKKDIKTGLRNL